MCCLILLEAFCFCTVRNGKDTETGNLKEWWQERLFCDTVQTEERVERKV